ncbi:Hypothetical_protein [Hexamita inflata]|uniref:Hypothetical_protein n=1 Tax=Hexamita inflata TaxID=28002 RepID=A0AA86TV38_9EUKA|nr:Hypothetical protein HINF_LOCUS17386 [Hexamita inflata]
MNAYIYGRDRVQVSLLVQFQVPLASNQHASHGLQLEKSIIALVKLNVIILASRKLRSDCIYNIYSILSKSPMNSFIGFKQLILEELQGKFKRIMLSNNTACYEAKQSNYQTNEEEIVRTFTFSEYADSLEYERLVLSGMVPGNSIVNSAKQFTSFMKNSIARQQVLYIVPVKSVIQLNTIF